MRRSPFLVLRGQCARAPGRCVAARVLASVPGLLSPSLDCRLGPAASGGWPSCREKAGYSQWPRQAELRVPLRIGSEVLCAPPVASRKGHTLPGAAHSLAAAGTEANPTQPSQLSPGQLLWAACRDRATRGGGGGEGAEGDYAARAAAGTPLMGGSVPPSPLQQLSVRQHHQRLTVLLPSPCCEAGSQAGHVALPGKEVTNPRTGPP